jgi:hypothetical protein
LLKIGKASCRGARQGKMCRAAETGVFDDERDRWSGAERSSTLERKKNFRQPLARTLEPGTLPEIFVDVERYFLSNPPQPSGRLYGVVSGPAQRIR